MPARAGQGSFPGDAEPGNGLAQAHFNKAERWGQHQGTNAVRLVKFLPEDNLRVETVSEAEEQSILLASPPYLRDMILFAINTGLRTSDILKLAHVPAYFCFAAQREETW
jgi:hypothetical protein